MTGDANEHSIEVRVDREQAFRIWSGRIDLWWPKRGHTRSGSAATTICLEPEVGGRLFERTADGREIHWGEVQAWEPPERIVHSWLMGTDPAHATLVEITFMAIGPQSTRIVVRHRAGRMAASDWAGMRGNFERGWAAVVDAYGAAITQEGRIT